jgi:hypothetical protein
MPSDTLVQHLLEQVEGSHFSLVRFVGRISRHEWDWAPDDGIRSARDVVLNLMREESRILVKCGGASKSEPQAATPSAAATALRALREETLAAMRRGGVGAREVLQSAVSLAQLDAHVLGEIALLQRLIDPSRATVSPR